MILHNKSAKFVVADFETTGLNYRYSKPWQLSWIICDNKNVISEHDRFIDIPNLYIPENIKIMTHFNQEKYDRLKQPPEVVLEEFEKYLYDENYFSIGQNFLGFDVYMLAHLQIMCGKKPDYSYLWRLLDTRCLGRAWKDKVKKPDKREEYIYWQYRLIHDKTNIRERVSLKALAKELGCDYDPNQHHDALYDVKLTFDVFKKLAKILEI